MDSPDDLTPPIELSIVVPVFNSDVSLIDIVKRFKDVFPRAGVANCEFVFIDDSSPNEKTWATITELCERDVSVNGFRLSRNFGKAGAVLCGLSHARGEYVLTIDDDLEQRPEDLPVLWEQRDHDVVIGAFVQKKHGLMVALSSKMKAWFDRVLIGKPKNLQFTPYKLYKRHVVDAMVAMKTPYPFISALMLYATADIVNVEVGHEKRRFGKVGFTFRKRVKQFMSLLINNSSFLLQLIALLGIALSCISLLYGGLIVYRAVVSDITIAGWSSLMATLLFIGGAILFSLGVIGEYLIRIIKGVENRPAYIVKDRR